MTNVVDCPNCDESFDAVAASRRRNPACPHCRKNWGQLHAMADPDYSEPEDVEIQRHHDGSVEVSAQ